MIRFIATIFFRLHTAKKNESCKTDNKTWCIYLLDVAALASFFCNKVSLNSKIHLNSDVAYDATPRRAHASGLRRKTVNWNIQSA